MTLRGYENSPVEEQFKAAMARRGLVPPKLVADGKLHRCSAKGKNGRGDGSYLLHLDGTIPAGGFQNWQDGVGWENWHFDPGRDLTASERDGIKNKAAADTRARQEAEARAQAKAREKAQRLWTAAASAEGHGYLLKKMISALGARRLYGCLIVPLYDANGILQNLQFITADGKNKRYLKGGRVKGRFYRIPGDRRKICIAEGFATAATNHATTGYTAIVAFDAGNLLSVAEAVAKAADGAEIIIAADDDWKRRGGNIGIQKATEAARAVGAKVAVPVFGQNRRDKDTDFNDLAEFIADSGPSRTVIPTDRGQRSGDCGQFLMSV
jgi:putative DNA primase/helicase